MKKALLFLLFLVFLGILYLAFYPVPINPGTWTPPPIPKLEGQYAVNSDLKVKRLFECHECEDVAIDSAGNIYGGSIDGEIIRYNKITKKREVFATTGGRPLGLHFAKNKHLIVADADKGLLSISPDGTVTTLDDGKSEPAFKFADDLDIGPDGTIYFSNASNKFGFHESTTDLFEHQPNGDLLAYYPSTQKTELLLPDLYFANGIAVSPDSNFVLVNETGKYHIRRYWIRGAKKGQTDIFIDNLPAFPDGISRGDNGVYWLALVSPRNADLDGLMSQPALRKVVMRLPQSIQPAPENYGFVLGLDQNGEVVHNLQDPSGSYGQVTSVQQFGNELYLGTLYEQAVGVVKVQ